MRIEGATCIVTGGAAGLGLATALVLRARGARVATIDLSPLPEAAAQAGIEHHVADITDEAQVEAAVGAVVARHGSLQVCVNCAGIVQSQPLIDPAGRFPVALFRRTVDVNLTGTFIVMAVAAEAMARNAPSGPDEERGAIVNTASIAAFDASSSVAYAASKGGVMALNLTAARQLAPYGIRVNAIAPGFMETELFANLPPDHTARLLSTTVFPQRLGRPEEFGALVCSIVESPFMNAATLRFDAGARC
ncbi:MAG: SDR family NAD(P)-dependent oxidoreductase [Janthinobacterium lividum]